MGDWTGTVPTFTAGAKLRGVDMATMAAIDTALVTAWTPYNSTWRSTGTQPALVNGTLTAVYRRLGKTVDVHIELLIGASSTFGTGTYYFDLPFTAVRESIGVCGALDANLGAFHAGTALVSALGGLQGLAFVTPLRDANNAVWTNAAPMTWAVSDRGQISVTYDIA